MEVAWDALIDSGQSTRASRMRGTLAANPKSLSPDVFGDFQGQQIATVHEAQTSVRDLDFWDAWEVVVLSAQRSPVTRISLLRGSGSFGRDEPKQYLLVVSSINHGLMPIEVFFRRNAHTPSRTQRGCVEDLTTCATGSSGDPRGRSLVHMDGVVATM